MRYLILGAGALGGYFGGMLIEGGVGVTFLVLSARAAQLRIEGLIVKTQDGGELRTEVRAVQQSQLDGTYDVVYSPARHTILAVPWTPLLRR